MSESKAIELLREFYEAMQHPLDWLNGNDAVADIIDQSPEDAAAVERTSKALEDVGAFLAAHDAAPDTHDALPCGWCGKPYGMHNGDGILDHAFLYPEPEQDVVRQKAALADAWQNRTKLLSGRWPCPECNRQSPDHGLKAINHTDGSSHGCWLCNTEDLRARYDAIAQQQEAGA